MTFTYQAVVDLARIPLNDEDKTRYSDATLMAYANSSIHELFKRRPDIFIGQLANPPDGMANLEDICPIESGYAMTLADYVTARVSMIDDEHATSGKATAFLALLGRDIS